MMMMMMIDGGLGNNVIVVVVIPYKASWGGGCPECLSKNIILIYALVLTCQPLAVSLNTEVGVSR